MDARPLPLMRGARTGICIQFPATNCCLIEPGPWPPVISARTGCPAPDDGHLKQSMVMRGSCKIRPAPIWDGVRIGGGHASLNFPFERPASSG